MTCDFARRNSALAKRSEANRRSGIRTVLASAYFCEELARPLGLSRNSSESFLLDMLSTADALLERPMPQALAELPLSAEIRTH